MTAIAAALIAFLWQGLLIALGLKAALTLAPDARDRYASCVAAMLLMLGVPLLTLAIGWSDAGTRLRSESTSPVAANGVSLIDVGAAISTRGASLASTRQLDWVVAIWLAGVALNAVRLAGGWLWLRGLVLRNTRPLGADWHRRTTALLLRLGSSREVRVLESSRVAVPLVVGVLRPVVLLPMAMVSAISVRQLELIILHELVHLRRLDPLFLHFQLLVETLLFYHPCVWWVSRTLDTCREHCCDEEVVALTGDPLGYAHALAELESHRSRNPRPALAANGGSLMSRVQQIVAPTTSAPRRRVHAGAARFTAGLILTVVGLTTLGIAVAPSTARDTVEIGAAIEWLPPAVERWRPLIGRAAADHDVDPGLLAIMMLLESRGDATAESRLGAVGLMQVMPNTAAAIARSRGLAEPMREELFEPATNLDYGAWFVAAQLREFGADRPLDQAIELAAAAYNAGPSRLRAYLEHGEQLSAETRRYKELVRGLWRDRGKSRSTVLDGLRSSH